MRKAIVFTVVLGMAAWAGDASEKGMTNSPLRIYSGGIFAGAVQSLSQQLQDEQKNYLKLSLQNLIFFKKHAAVFCDIDWFLPGINPGADIGFDFIGGKGSFHPFIGAGAGAHYFDRDTGKFGDKIGPSVTAHIGFSLDLNDRVQMRMRVPYHAVFNETDDQVVGVEVGFLFSGRFKNIRKLNYN